MKPRESAAWMAGRYSIRGAHLVDVSALTEDERETLDRELERLGLVLATTTHGTYLARDYLEVADEMPERRPMETFCMHVLSGEPAATWRRRARA